MIIHVCDCCGKEIGRVEEDWSRAHAGKCQEALKAFKEHVDQSLAKTLTDLESTKDAFVKARLGHSVDAAA